MLIKGEALIDTVTLTFTVSGKRREWKVSVTAPGGTATEETVEATWYLLLNEMLLAAYETVRRKRSLVREAAR